MNNIKEKLKNKKVIVSIVCAVIGILIAIAVFFTVSENQRKQDVLDSMSIEFNTDLHEVEYGSKLENGSKSFVKNLTNGEVKDYPDFDTKKVGETIIKFSLINTNEDLSKDFEFKVNVVDTQKPEIEIKEDNIELTVGDEFDINSNIESITDKVDGEIKINKDAKDINKKATEKYNKLSDEEKTKVDTILVDKLKISDFKIEDIKDKKEKNLYLKNCYFIDGSVDTSKAEEYTIKVFATDKNGLNSEKEFKVTVKELVKEETPVSANVNSSNGGGSGTWSETTPNDANQSASVPQPQEPVNPPKGKDWMINYALSLVGQPSGSCQDFVDQVLREAGYLNSSQPNFAYGGYKIPLNEVGPGDILANSTHVMLITSYPKINEYGLYEWNTVEGGVGPTIMSSTVNFNINNTFDYYAIRY